MENTNIINEEIMEVAEEVVVKGMNPYVKGGLVVTAAGVALAAGYKFVAKPLVAKIKTKMAKDEPIEAEVVEVVDEGEDQ